MTEDRLQRFFPPWWTTCEKKLPLRRGQLVYAFVAHVGLTPYVLTPEGRTEATEHERASVQIGRARVGALAKKTNLPVAALPQYPGEVWTVHRAKVRPCLVLAVAGTDVPKALAGTWQTKPAFLVAPAYGSEQTAKRAGWPKQLVERIQACEYPQYMLEQLPTGRAGESSVVRFDHIQPVGAHHDSVEPTEHCLSEDALAVVDEWIRWYVFREMPSDSLLYVARETLLANLDDAGG